MQEVQREKYALSLSFLFYSLSITGVHSFSPSLRIEEFQVYEVVCLTRDTKKRQTINSHSLLKSPLLSQFLATNKATVMNLSSYLIIPHKWCFSDASRSASPVQCVGPKKHRKQVQICYFLLYYVSRLLFLT